MQITVDVSPDATRLRITAATVYLDMPALDVDQLIRLLIAGRATMTPAIVTSDAGQPAKTLSASNMRWTVVPDPVLPSQILLLVLLPGLGWISLPLREAEAQLLPKMVEQALQDRPTAQ